MEFDYNINNLFSGEITLIDKTLKPCRSSPLSRDYQTQLCRVIDKMGEASAKAQSLGGSITSSHKMKISDHHLYVMKDAEANGGRGAVVGLLKVGHKRLFVYDPQGAQHEMEPLCALDFYVHESRQRAGCGRRLYAHMLKAEGMKPHHIAVDRPSHKFLSFLARHYNLKATVKQVNNFVVFDSFFRDKPANAVIDRRRFHQKPPLHPYKRQAPGASKLSDPDVDRPPTHTTTDRPPSGSRVPLSVLEKQRASQTDEESLDESLPRRFTSLGLLSWDDTETQTKMEGLANIPLQRQGSRESSFGEGDRPGSRAKAMAAQGSMYSRYGNQSPAPATHHHGNPDQPQPARTHGNTDQHSRYGNASPAPVIGSTIEPVDVSKRMIGGLDPPIRTRDGPSADYTRFGQREGTSNGRGRQLNTRPQLSSSPEKTSSLSSATAHHTSSTSQAAQSMYSTKPRALNSAWNVFGVPPNPRSVDQSTGSYQPRRW